MENWKIGKHPSTVVSDVKVKNTNFPVPTNPEESRDEDIEHYGGYLVCESIGNFNHAKLIAAAPELLEALCKARALLISMGVEVTNRIGGDEMKYINAAIIKANY